MREIKDWNTALNLYLKESWIGLAAWTFVMIMLFEIVWGIIVFAVMVAFGSLAMKSKLICYHDYGLTKCGKIVIRSENFCSNCGNKVPEELKPRRYSSRSPR